VRPPPDATRTLEQPQLTPISFFALAARTLRITTTVHVRRSPPTLLPSIFCPDQPCLGCLTAAYTKLAALPEALKDANTAISLDPKFVKAYIRKSLVLSGMRDYTKAIEACAEATDADADKKHTREIETQIRKCYELQQQERAGETEQQTLERAMKDPEVAVSARLCRSYLLAASHIILTPPLPLSRLSPLHSKSCKTLVRHCPRSLFPRTPTRPLTRLMPLLLASVMRNILEQAQSDPRALQDHMKSPLIRQKIMKLEAAGVIRLGSR
jgi:tetratricopeptide (TPR) repeat protein